MDNMGNDLNSFLVTGSTGLLGREIERNIIDYNSKFYFTSRSQKKGNLQCDLTSFKDVKNPSFPSREEKSCVNDFYNKEVEKKPLS